MSGLAHAIPKRSPTSGVLPLVNGDRMSRDEFERRFDATPGLKKAELIEGRVYMPPPVSYDGHSSPHFGLLTWLGVYQSNTLGVRGGGDGSIRMDLDNMPQPDGFLFIMPRYGGQARISADDYVEGAPELVAEVAASSTSYDLHDKLQVYRRNGVREYVVHRTLEAAIDYFILRGAEYIRHSSDSVGRYRSEVFPGLWLDSKAMLAGDLGAVLKCLQDGLASPEHAAFVARLNAAAK